MSRIEERIDVGVPPEAAYAQWARLAALPNYSEGVDRVDEIGGALSHWVTNIAGVPREFDAELTGGEPGRRLSWRSVHGVRHHGSIAFRPLEPGRCRVLVELDFAPDGLLEHLGDRLGLVARQVRKDLARFAKYVEAHRPDDETPPAGPEPGAGSEVGPGEGASCPDQTGCWQAYGVAC